MNSTAFHPSTTVQCKEVCDIFVFDARIFLYNVCSEADNEMGEYIRHVTVANACVYIFANRANARVNT